MWPTLMTSCALRRAGTPSAPAAATAVVPCLRKARRFMPASLPSWVRGASDRRSGPLKVAQARGGDKAAVLATSAATPRMMCYHVLHALPQSGCGSPRAETELERLPEASQERRDVGSERAGTSRGGPGPGRREG